MQLESRGKYSQGARVSEDCLRRTSIVLVSPSTSRNMLHRRTQRPTCMGTWCPHPRGDQALSRVSVAHRDRLA
jgi:hypothetical protein